MLFFSEASITIEEECTKKKKYNADSSRCQSCTRSPPTAYKTSVLQLISVASAAVSSSIKVFSPVTSLIKSTTTTKDSYEKREAEFLAILFHPTRYYNESNRDPILIGDSLRRDVSAEGKIKSRSGTVKIKWRSREQEEEREDGAGGWEKKNTRKSAPLCEEKLRV